MICLIHVQCIPNQSHYTTTFMYFFNVLSSQADNGPIMVDQRNCIILYVVYNQVEFCIPHLLFQDLNVTDASLKQVMLVRSSSVTV